MAQLIADVGDIQAARLQNNAWFPSGISYAWYIGGLGTGNAVGNDAGFGFENGNTHTFPIIINFTDTLQAIADLLGTNIINKTVPGHFQLNRTPPMQDPWYPNLYCSRISGQHPIAFIGKQNQLGAGAAIAPDAAVYAFMILTLTFTQPTWNRTLGDNDLIQLYGAGDPWPEWNRFTTISWRPGLETLSRPPLINGVDQFKFADGPNSGVGIKANVAQKLAKADVIITWHRIPKFAALFSTANGSPDNIMSGVGTVNNAAFLGFPKGTLLLLPPEIVELQDPIDFSVLKIPPKPLGQTSILCDVHFPFAYFDPPFGNALYRGHNTFPVAGQASGNWYRATTTGTVTDASFYGASDFTQLFRLPG